MRKNNKELLFKRHGRIRSDLLKKTRIRLLIEINTVK